MLATTMLRLARRFQRRQRLALATGGSSLSRIAFQGILGRSVLPECPGALLTLLA
jgi:hypothetical protein